MTNSTLLVSSTVEIIVYGASVLLITLIFMLLYVPIIVIFFYDKEFRKSPAYTIMTHIAITDVAQLVIHLYSGVLVVLQTQPIYWLDKFFGAVMTGLWFSMIFFTLFLNYNRLATIMLYKYRQLNTKQFTISLYAVCYLSFIVPFILKLFPDNNYLFNTKFLYWAPPITDGPVSSIQRAVSNYLILVVVVTSILTYVAIFMYISLVSNTKLTKREFRITIQISLVIGYFLFSFFYWRYMPSSGMFWSFASMLVWVVMNGIHAIIYLIFNERLRKSFLGVLTRGKIPDTSQSHNVILVARMVTKIHPMRTTTIG